MPEELRTEVHNTVQEAVIKTIPKKRNAKRQKWFSEEALQIAEKRREEKGQKEKERYAIKMQNSKEQQGEKRKPFLVINAKR